MTECTTESIMIVRRVKPDRRRMPQQALWATDRYRFVTDAIVEAMPKGEGEDVEVRFFKLDRWMNDDDLEKEYEKRGLKAADPYSLAAVNEADPSFADKYPNCTHWKDKEGKWCHVTFDSAFGDRHLSVYHSDRGSEWSLRWFIAGIPKSKGL